LNDASSPLRAIAEFLSTVADSDASFLQQVNSWIGELDNIVQLFGVLGS
jgi:hypothetical protein